MCKTTKEELFRWNLKVILFVHSRKRLLYWPSQTMAMPLITVMKRLLLMWHVVIAFSGVCRAQEMLGLVNSNVAEVDGILINPAQLVNSKLYLDINLFTFNSFIDNSYLYIHKEDYKFLEFFRKQPQLPSYSESSMPLDHYWDKINHYLYENLRLIGPSAMMVRGRHAFAFQTALRAVTSLRRIPYHLANFIYEGLNFVPQQNINYSAANVTGATLVWGETGLSYSCIIAKRSKYLWTGGLTVKRLFGYSGAYFKADDMNYMVLNDSTLDIRRLNGEAGFALDMDYRNNDFPFRPPLIKGRGISFDIGVTFQKKSKDLPIKPFYSLCSQVYSDYLFRIGLSVIDLGWIRFTDHAQKHLFRDVNYYWEHFNEFTYTSVDGLFHELSGRFYDGDSTRSLVSDRVTVFLPTAVSVQADYRYYGRMYFNATFIYPLRVAPAQIVRPPLLAVTARFESHFFGMNLPLILYDLKYPRIGFSLRFWNLTVGSDKVLAFFNLTDFTGLDFYASLKLNFIKGRCLTFKKKYACKGMEFR